MTVQTRSIRGRKRQVFEDQDELTGDCNPRPSKRQSLECNADTGEAATADSVGPVGDTNTSTAVNSHALVLDKVAARPAAPVKTQKKKRGRKRKNGSVLTPQVDETQADAGEAEASITRAIASPDAMHPTSVSKAKPKKKRGRPKKLDAADAPALAEAAQICWLTTCAASQTEKSTETRSGVAHEQDMLEPHVQIGRDDNDGSIRTDTVLRERRPNSSTSTPSRNVPTAEATSHDTVALSGTEEKLQASGDAKKDTSKGKDKRTAADKKPAAPPIARYRVGLSKKQRIQPLLKMIRK